MQVSRDACELTRNAFATDNLLNLVNRGRAGIPDGLRVISAKIFDEFVQGRVRYSREMSGRMTSIHLSDTGTFDHRHAEVVLF